MSKFEKLYNKIICQMLQSSTSLINDKINLLFDKSDLFDSNNLYKINKDIKYIDYDFGIEPSLKLSDNSECFYLGLTKPIQISYHYNGGDEYELKFEPGYRSFPFSKDLNNKSNDEIFQIDVKTEEGQDKELLFSTLSQEDKYKIINAIIDYLDSQDFSEDFNQQVDNEVKNRAIAKADLDEYHKTQLYERQYQENMIDKQF